MRTLCVGCLKSSSPHGQAPIGNLVTMAEDLLGGQRADPTRGSAHFHSSRSMPKEGESMRHHDVAGGLEPVPSLTARSYRPDWVLEFVDMPAVQSSFYKFYRRGQG